MASQTECEQAEGATILERALTRKRNAIARTGVPSAGTRFVLLKANEPEL